MPDDASALYDACWQQASYKALAYTRRTKQQQHTPPTYTVGVCAAVCFGWRGGSGRARPTRHTKQKQHTSPTYIVGIVDFKNPQLFEQGQVHSRTPIGKKNDS